MDELNNVELDSLRASLAAKVFDQGVHYRILFVSGAGKEGRDHAASLCRALRNLGHHVFDLDLEKHISLTDTRRSIVDTTEAFLQASEFDRFCTQFSPQIIILCANGLTFTVEHAERLKQQEIVLVGVALGELNVIASPPSNSDVFDFYAVCSRIAHARNRSVGLHKTLYLPFAFDRAAITDTPTPECYRKRTAKAFRRIAAGHLYEHRCMALLETIFNCSPDSTPWLADARIESIRATLSRSLPRCKQVIVSGFYGASNAGDELILRAIASALHASDAAVQVKVAAENPVAVERDHGLQAFFGKNQNEALYQVRTACAIFVGGGGLWHDYSFARSGGLTGIFQEPQLSMASFAALPMLGRFFNIPCHVVGMGVGPITTPDAFRMLRFVAELAETIHVRDQPSLALLVKAGVSQGKAFMAPDLVYALSLPKVAPAAVLMQLKAEGYTIVGINLRPWAQCDERALFARVRQALQSLSPAVKLAIVTIPMQNPDNTTLAKFVAEWGGEVSHVALKAPLALEELLGALSACDVVLAMRLHTCLLAHRLRKPVVGLAYDPKVENHFEQTGRLAFALALDAPASDIAEAIRTALGEKGQLPSDTERNLLALEARARAVLNIATQRIARLSCADRVFEAPKEQGSIRAELNQLRALHKTQLDKKTQATLTNILASGSGFDASEIQAAIHTSADRIALNLPTNQPHAGQSITCQATLDVAEECAELNLLLETNYANPNLLGSIQIRLQLGDLLLTEDLAQEEGVIRLHLGVPARARNLPLSLTLHTRQTVFESGAWPRVTRLALSINHDAVHVGQRSANGYLLASRGVVSKLDAKELEE